MATNSQSRKWSLTFNNPQSIGLDHEAMQEILAKFAPRYYCMADEIATTGTYHTHVFMLCDSPVRFSTIKNRFPIAHIEKAYGSAKDNRDYILKTGKWAETKKADTSVPDTFREWGSLPTAQEEKAPAMAQLLQDIQDGKSTTDIILENPNLSFRVRDIDVLRQTLLAERYATEIRNIDVTYIYGASGVGKTRSIFKKHLASDICRITNYRGSNGVNFDSYNGQDVLVFEEYRSQIPIGDMLNYLDIYPLHLPARYTDRIACYTKVYLTSNISLEDQYWSEQRKQPETWKAFLRRIHNVIEYLPDGTTITWKEGGHSLDGKR